MGRDKAALPWPPGAGTTLLDWLVGTLEPLCREVLIVGREHAAYRALPDPVPDQGPLQGLAAGLRAARTEWCLAIGVDLPFLHRSVLKALRERAGGQAVVPRVGGRAQPLVALYHRSCLPAIEAALVRGERRMDGFWGEVEVRFVEEDELQPFDPGLLAFRSVNTPEEWAEARALWTVRASPPGSPRRPCSGRGGRP